MGRRETPTHIVSPFVHFDTHDNQRYIENWCLTNSYFKFINDRGGVGVYMKQHDDDSFKKGYIAQRRLARGDAMIVWPHSVRILRKFNLRIITKNIRFNFQILYKILEVGGFVYNATKSMFFYKKREL